MNIAFVFDSCNIHLAECNISGIPLKGSQYYLNNDQSFLFCCCFLAQITIQITDVNDNAPAFQPPGTDTIILQVSESVGQGNSVPGAILALDPDSGDNGLVTYVIDGDTSGLPISVDPNTGIHSFKT